MEILFCIWVLDAWNQAIVAKNRPSDMQLVAKRPFVTAGAFFSRCRRAEDTKQKVLSGHKGTFGIVLCARRD
jgi:transposase-like protein